MRLPRPLLCAVIALVPAYALAARGGVRVVHAQPAAAAQTPLAQIDWAAAIAADPHMQQPAHANMPSIPGLGLFTIANFDGVELEGFPELGGILYADLDGDGAAEAVIPFFGAGASGGTLGFAVFHAAGSAPALLWLDSEYAALRSVTIVAGTTGPLLLVTRPGFVGFEPVIAPSSWVTTPYTLNADGPLAYDPTVLPNDNQAVTVSAFYQALNERRFADAYAFLGPDFTATQPYDAWAASFASTVSVAVDVQRNDADPATVSVAITAVDRVTDGGTTTDHFAGTWHLIFDQAQRRWLLDEAAIALD